MFDPASQTAIFGATSQRLASRYHEIATVKVRPPWPNTSISSNFVVEAFRESDKTTNSNESLDNDAWAGRRNRVDGSRCEQLKQPLAMAGNRYLQCLRGQSGGQHVAVTTAGTGTGEFTSCSRK